MLMMEAAIGDIEKCLDKCQEFIFKLRKFFRKNPDVLERFIKFLQEKEDLIF
jgi:histone deacetylase complex regulatory component SIN3